MTHFYLYRLQVTYPEGSHQPHKWLGEDWPVPVADWAPPNWIPGPEYIERFKTESFVWPKASHIYRSQSAAKTRARLLESYGATVIIERSSRITWPDNDDLAATA